MSNKASHKGNLSGFLRKRIFFVFIHIVHIGFLVGAFFFVQKMLVTDYIIETNNELFPEKSSIVFVVRDIPCIDVSELITHEDMKEVSLFYYNQSISQNYQLIFKGTGKHSFPKGASFFTESPKNEKYTYVLGTDRELTAEEKEALREIAEKVPVQELTRLKRSFNEAENLCKIVMTRNLYEIDTGEAFVLTSTKKKYVNKAYQTLEDIVQQKNGRILLREQTFMRYEDYFGGLRMDRLLMLGFLTLLFCSEYISFLFYFSLKYPLYFVLTLLGKKKVAFSVYQKMVGLLCVDHLLGTILLLCMYPNTLTEGILSLLLTELVVFTIACFTAFLALHRVLRQKRFSE